MIGAIFKFFNINLDNNQKWIFFSYFLSGLILTYISPIFMKTVITALPPEWIAFQNLFMAISALVIGMIWKGKIRENALKYFIWFCIIESILGFGLSLYLAFIQFNVWVYAIFSLIYTSLITIFVGKCIMVFKTKLWNEEKRESYDNNEDVIGSITCILGFLCALLFMPSLEVALVLYGLMCIIDDIGWIIVYSKNKNSLKEI